MSSDLARFLATNPEAVYEVRPEGFEPPTRGLEVRRSLP
jgi:hypothetical protein